MSNDREKKYEDTKEFAKGGIIERPDPVLTITQIDAICHFFDFCCLHVSPIWIAQIY